MGDDARTPTPGVARPSGPPGRGAMTAGGNAPRAEAGETDAASGPEADAGPEAERDAGSDPGPHADPAAPDHPLLAGAVLRPSGEGAFAVEFGDAIDPALQDRVLALAAALDAAAPPGLFETVPTYRSLLVLHDPDATGPEALLAALPPDAPAGAGPGRRWRVPVCLEGDAAEDLDEAAGLLGLVPDELRARLLASPLRVAMYGFAPGLAYLGGLDPALAVPRRETPRPPMPASSVILAGGQAALASASMPTGWYVVGRAAVAMFDPEREPMVPFAVGDRLALEAVDEARLAALAREGGGLERLGLMARLVVTAAGPGASIQDAGRRGHLRHGVSGSGPMDWARHALALALAEAPPGGPAIELGLGGLSVEAEGGPVALGIAGPGFAAWIEEPGWGGGAGRVAVEPPAALALAPGARLVVRAGARGMWAYLAARGLDPGPAVLGSHATNLRTGLGPPPPAPGSAYPCAEVEPEEARAPPRPARDPLEGDDAPIRLLPGPQRHLFGAAADALVAAPYRVTERQDRMGTWLEGAPLRLDGGHDIVSDGVVEGALQVPGSGQPVALMADRQTTGGYPKIAVVARADLPRLAQRRAGEAVRFAWTALEAAHAARRALAEAVARPEPRPRRALSSAFLLSVDLVSGVWEG